MAWVCMAMPVPTQANDVIEIDGIDETAWEWNALPCIALVSKAVVGGTAGPAMAVPLEATETN